MIQFGESRSGALIATAGGKSLHSRFDPRQEALRYLNNAVPDQPRTIIIIGPAVGYLCEAARERREDCHVVAIGLSSELASRAVNTGDDSWHPDCPASLERFLHDSLHPLESASIGVVEWLPATAAFPDEASRAREAVAAVLPRLQAGLVTEGGTGRRWIRNAAINFLSAAPLRIVAANREVGVCVIAAAGPSLEASIPAIRAARDAMLLFALGSAVTPLAYSGVYPDLVVTTDASPYATMHLRAILSSSASTRRETIVAAPLSASRGVFRQASCVLDQNDEFEGLLLGDLQTGHAPAAGTVAATALAIAESLAQWPIVFAGLDLAWYRLRSHARPHLSESFRQSSSGRTTPPDGLALGSDRSIASIEGDWSSDRAMAVYGSWFREHHISNPLYRLNPSPVETGMEEIAAADLRRLPRQFAALAAEPAGWPAGKQRNEILRAACRTARAEVASLNDHGVPSWRVLVDHHLGIQLAMRMAPIELLRWYREEDKLEKAITRTVQEIDALEESFL